VQAVAPNKLEQDMKYFDRFFNKFFDLCDAGFDLCDRGFDLCSRGFDAIGRLMDKLDGAQ